MKFEDLFLYIKNAKARVLQSVEMAHASALLMPIADRLREQPGKCPNDPGIPGERYDSLGVPTVEGLF